jgi:integrase
VTVRARPSHPLTGRRFWIHAETERELNAYLHHLDGIRTQIRLGVLSIEQADRLLRNLRHGVVTLERAVISYCERPGLAENTKRGFRSLLATHWRPLAGVPLQSLDAQVVQKWVNALSKAGLRGTTIGTAWHKLRSVALHAHRKGWIGSSPWGSFRPEIKGGAAKPLREAARTVEELVRLLEAAAELDTIHEADDWPPMLEAMIAFAALLGLRQGELGGLRWTDYEPGPPPLVAIARQWDGQIVKGKLPKRLETIAELGEILIRHRARLERAGLYRAEGPIFPCESRSTPGKPKPYLRGQVLKSLDLRSAVERAQLPNIGAWSGHSLRDTFVTLEAQATGGDLSRVQARSRHASLASLARYLRALSRNNPASPAVTFLPGRFQQRDAGALAPLLPASSLSHDEVDP